MALFGGDVFLADPSLACVARWITRDAFLGVHDPDLQISG